MTAKGRISALRTRSIDASKDLAQRVARPKRFEKFTDGSTRVSQILALVFLGPVIIVSLTLIVVFNGVMSDVFGANPPGGEQQDIIIGWLVTAITLGAFILAVWSWFQFVRTSGFGFFSWGAK